MPTSWCDKRIDELKQVLLDLEVLLTDPGVPNRQTRIENALVYIRTHIKKTTYNPLGLWIGARK